MSATVIGDYGVGPAGGSPLLVDLVAYWKMDDVTDAHGANDLSNNNGVSFASAGKLGNCATLVATSTQSLSITDNADLSVGDIDFSVAFWAKFNTSITVGNESLIFKWAGSTDEYRIYREASNTRFNVGTSSDAVATTGGLSTSVWYYFIAIHDSVANTIQLWINNTITNGPISYSGGATDGNSSFVIGNGGFGFLDGAIDEVGFWKKALSIDDRADLYNDGTGLTYPFS